MLDKNFTLTAVTPITVSVNIRYPITPNSDVSPSASISFRKLQECTPAVGTQVIEVDKLNVAGEGDFPIDLPKGEYSYVASSEGMDPVSGMLNTDSPTLDIEFVASAPPQ